MSEHFKLVVPFLFLPFLKCLYFLRDFWNLSTTNSYKLKSFLATPLNRQACKINKKNKRKNNRDTTNLFTKRLYISLMWQKKKSYDKQSFLWALKMHHLQGEQAINVFLLTKYVSWGNIVLFSLWDYNFENFILPKYSILKLNWKLERNAYSF